MWHVSGIFRARPEGFYGEPKSPRLGGCAGSPPRTRLSLLKREMQRDPDKKQGTYCGSAGSIPYDQLGFVRARADCSFATNEVMALITHDPLQEADLSG